MNTESEDTEQPDTQGEGSPEVEHGKPEVEQNEEAPLPEIDEAELEGIDTKYGPLDVSSFQHVTVTLMEKYMRKCLPHGLICGSAPFGNCTACYSRRIPRPLFQIAELELRDQPPGFKALGMSNGVLDLRVYFWVKALPSGRVPPGFWTDKGVTHPGWWRRWGARYVPAVFNLIRPDQWRVDLSFVWRCGLKLVKYNPNRRIDMSPEGKKALIDGGPGLYLIPPNNGGHYMKIEKPEDLHSLVDEEEAEENDHHVAPPQGDGVGAPADSDGTADADSELKAEDLIAKRLSGPMGPTSHNYRCTNDECTYHGNFAKTDDGVRCPLCWSPLQRKTKPGSGGKA